MKKLSGGKGGIKLKLGFFDPRKSTTEFYSTIKNNENCGFAFLGSKKVVRL